MPHARHPPLSMRCLYKYKSCYRTHIIYNIYAKSKDYVCVFVTDPVYLLITDIFV